MTDGVCRSRHNIMCGAGVDVDDSKFGDADSVERAHDVEGL